LMPFLTAEHAEFAEIFNFSRRSQPTFRTLRIE
jgi:hypothetical protein